jgi:multidrug resistance efflux pump
VKLSGAVGTFAIAGQSLMMFVPDEVWVVANYKETQLRDMRPGQPVEFTISRPQADRPRSVSAAQGRARRSVCCPPKMQPAIM